tara:strand:+ start:431 stop:592 length:162 start_codon:yes stop_codon:yes gene_type:complete
MLSKLSILGGANRNDIGFDNNSEITSQVTQSDIKLFSDEEWSKMQIKGYDYFF